MSAARRRRPEAAQVPGRHLVTVTKADARSSVHRRAWLDLVAVSAPRDGEGVPAAPLRRPVPVVGVHGQRAGRAARAAPGRRGHRPLRRARRQPHRQGAARGPGDLPPGRAAAGRRRRAAAGRRRRPAPAGAAPDPAVPAPGPDRPVLVGRWSTCRATGTRPRSAWRCSSCCWSGWAAPASSTRPGPPSRCWPGCTSSSGCRWAGTAGRGRWPWTSTRCRPPSPPRARSWTDDLADALVARHGADGEPLFARVADAFPAAYQDDFPAERAVDDLAQLENLTPGQLALRLWTPDGAGPGERRLTVYRVGERLLLSDVLPLLQHMGVSVVDERPYEIDRIGRARSWIYDFGVAVPAVDLPLVRSLPERFTDALGAVWRGDAEDDGLGALVLLAGLNWRQVGVVRAYVQWLRQAGLPFSQAYVESTLAAHPDVVSRLVALFEARFSPRSTGDRDERQAVLTESLRRSIGEVESLDADRVLSSLLAAITATQRTTYYAMSAAPHPVLALKLDPASVPDLPEPRPAREVWVSSPRVMGIHLRFGAVARGGLRWSDRREDLRTEVLGLVKAQMVKNTVIVPTGAKGGFVVKRPPADPLPRGPARRGPGLLQDLHRGAAVADRQPGRRRRRPRRPRRAARRRRHLPGGRRRQGDGDLLRPGQLDRGRARLLAGRRLRLRRLGRLRPQGHGHHRPRRLGVGHPALPRARPRRRTSRTSPSSASATCPATSSATGCCCPSTSGWWPPSTTGTSSSTPTPDAASSFAERRRLFDLPRSSWADYDRRADQRRAAACGRGRRSRCRSPSRCARRSAWPRASTALSPEELIRAILLAPVDLLFNGGIGTYVKAAAESARRRGGQGQRRGPGGRRPAAGAGRRRGRQPRAHPARPDRVRAGRRAGEHRRHRQLRGRRHLRPRGQHQDRAQRGGRPRRAGRRAAAPSCSAR